MQTRINEETFSTFFFYTIVGSVIFFLALLGVCAAQEQVNSGAIQVSVFPTAADRSKPIYVSDFTLEAGTSESQSARTRKLVDLMSKSLVAELTKSGFTAYRLSANDASPSDGLVLTGRFTALEQGSQIRRALIGFGSGASHIEVSAKLVEAAHPDSSLYEASSQQSSGKKPGAVIAPSPIVAVVKLGLTRNAPEKTVKKIAQQIASQLTSKIGNQMTAQLD